MATKKRTADEAFGLLEQIGSGIAELQNTLSSSKNDETKDRLDKLAADVDALKPKNESGGTLDDWFNDLFGFGD